MKQMALVGVAHIHTPNFIKRLQARDDIQVVSVWDHDATRAARRAHDLGARVAGDVDSIWADDAVEAVVICSENARHQPLVEAAARAGKAMFVEKPLGLGARDAYVMADAIEAAGVIFQTGYFMRGSPIYRFLRDEVRRGHLGQITRMRMSNCHSGALGGWFDTEWRWTADMDEAGMGGFGDLGTHVLDIMVWTLGKVESVTATVGMGTARYSGCDETGEGLLRFQNGVIGTLAAAWDDVANPVTLILSGTQGHATVFNNDLYYQSQLVEGADGKTPWTDLPAAWPHAFELFLDAVVGKANVPLVTAREAAYRCAVTEAMYDAARSGTWVRPKL